MTPFLLTGGMPVIRGLLSAMRPSAVLRANVLTDVAFRLVYEKLVSKGRIPTGPVPTWLRPLVQDIARGMNIGSRIMSDRTRTLKLTDVPTKPGGEPGSKVENTVRVTIINPDDTRSDVVVRVTTIGVPGRAALLEGISEALQMSVAIESDPDKAARSGGELHSWSILSTFRHA